MRYIPHSKKDIEQMLNKIGVQNVDDLFDQIPKSACFTGELNLPEPLSEPELQELLNEMADSQATSMNSFLGAGIYNHFVPSSVDQLLTRSEFYTAYTPYQPEISQGTLQAIFEFQTMVARIFNMQTANASMYDGATALVEAALMARRVTRKQRIVASLGVHPEYLDTLKTYLAALDGNLDALTFVEIDSKTGQTNLNKLKNSLTDDVSCLLIGYPNFFGVVEPINEIVPLAKEKNIRVATSTLDPFAFGVLQPPGSLGVDIATSEGQSISVPQSFGGPGLGLFAIADDKKLLRQMPGRLIGKTKDTNDKEGYVLTLATREQHIRREKATSNICTNHGLCALSCVINTSMIGKEGYKQIALSCLSRAQYLKTEIDTLEQFEVAHSGATFNEFVVRSKTKPAHHVLSQLENEKILGGVNLNRFFEDEHSILIAVTELSSKKKMDKFIAALKQC